MPNKHLQRIGLDKRNQIHNILTSANNKFSNIRTQETLQQYCTVNLDNVRAPNAIQRQSGFDATSHMKGEVTYSKLRTIHVPFLQQEI